MDTRKIATEFRLGHWSGIMRDRKESGMSIRRWCRENGVSEKTYYYWQRKLRENVCEKLEQETRTSASLVPAAPTFAQVQLAEATPLAGQIRIRLGETEVEIEGNASPEVVERVLRVLRSTC